MAPLSDPPTGTPYVPGRTPRPAEGAWDAIRSLALDPTTTATAGENRAWQIGLDLVETGYWWEAHEVLEQVWMNAPANAPEKTLVQSVIQIANGALKIRMDRPHAAIRLAAIARELIESTPGDDGLMGLSRQRLLRATEILDHAATEGTLPQFELR